MALDKDTLAVAMREEAVTEILALGYDGVDEDMVREGVDAIAKGFAKAIVEELQNNAEVTVSVPNITAGVATASGTGSIT